MIAQYSPEWYAARLGRVTASRIADLTARTKSGYSTSRANYMAQLIAERLTGVAQDSYTNAAMQWGLDHEAEAVTAYEFRTGRDTEEIGIVEHPVIPMSSASPDRGVIADGLLEIKCPNTATHLDALLGNRIDEKYIKQMQWQMVCCGRSWCDFASYDPRMPEAMRLYVRRVHRDNTMIAGLEKEVRTFLAELDEKIEALTCTYVLGTNLVKSKLKTSLEMEHGGIG